MIVHKFCNVKEIPPNTIAQIMLDGSAHYTYEHKVTQDERIRKILEYIDRENLYVETYPGCAEAGYEDKEVVAADWNGPSSYINDKWDWENTGCNFVLTEHGKRRQKMKKLANFFEKMCPEFSLEWEDEWMGCSECGKAVRSSPDSYCWEPSYVSIFDNMETICRECWKDNIEEIIEDYKSDYHHGFSNKALPSDFCEILESQGFTCWQEKRPWESEESCARYETGFHPGQNDDPKTVFKKIMEDDKRWIVVFVITSRGQFDINWSAFCKLDVED